TNTSTTGRKIAAAMIPLRESMQRIRPGTSSGAAGPGCADAAGASAAGEANSQTARTPRTRPHATNGSIFMSLSPLAVERCLTDACENQVTHKTNSQGGMERSSLGPRLGCCLAWPRCRYIPDDLLRQPRLALGPISSFETLTPNRLKLSF